MYKIAWSVSSLKLTEYWEIEKYFYFLETRKICVEHLNQ